MQDERIEQRVRAAYRARACAAGVACGAQICAVGTGLLLPLALNAAYWAAVPALLLGGVVGLAAPKRLSKAPGSAFCAVLALSLLVCGALLLGAGATLAQQTLLPNGHLLTCLMLTLGFCLLAARPGGTGVCRVAFALRLLLPVALVVFAGFSLSSASAAGLFPLLGAGVRPLLLAALKQPDSFTRQNETAHFTASAWVVNPARDKVLMIYHNIYNSWSWTGGHADGETDLLAVALREVAEETGLQTLRPVSRELFSVEILTVDGHEKRGRYVPSHLHLNCTYLIEADDTEPLRVKPDENSGVRWFAPREALAACTEPWMRDRIYQKLIEKNTQYK